MSEQQPPQGDLNQEFRNLGKNLATALQAVWESPERKRLQQDLETGLKELGTTLRQEVNTFSESPTGQRVKSEVQDVSQRVKSGEVQQKIRDELVSALQALNSQLEKAAANMPGSRTETDEGLREVHKGGDVAQYAGTDVHEIHPDDVDSTSPSTGHIEIHPDDVEAEPPPES